MPKTPCITCLYQYLEGNGRESKQLTVLDAKRRNFMSRLPRHFRVNALGELSNRQLEMRAQVVHFAETTTFGDHADAYVVHVQEGNFLLLTPATIVYVHP